MKSFSLRDFNFEIDDNAITGKMSYIYNAANEGFKNTMSGDVVKDGKVYPIDLKFNTSFEKGTLHIMGYNASSNKNFVLSASLKFGLSLPKCHIRGLNGNNVVTIEKPISFGTVFEIFKILILFAI